MKQCILFSVCAILLGATLCAASTPVPNGNLDEILAKMQTAARAVRSLTAHLQQETRDPLIGGRAQGTASGQIIFLHGSNGDDKVRINYDRPAGQVLCVAGDEIILYQPAIKQATITRRRALAEKNQEFDFLVTPYASISSLKARYEIAHVGDERVNGALTAKLDLTPKIKSSVHKLALWVDQSSWLPVKYQVTEVNQTVTTFTLSNLKTGQKITSDTFKVHFAPGTQTVRP
jgi:outer membrane lipoprotein-sorting protein